MAAPPKLTDHGACPHHEDDHICHGIRRDLTACTNRASVFQDGYLPVCRIHTNYIDPPRSFRCQALEECGRPCNRQARRCEPYNLCKIHEGGTKTIPCHILRLPVELRLMIFRRLFPEIIPAERPFMPRVNTAILKVNRQLSEEASAILYGETRFLVSVDAGLIQFLGKKWKRPSNDHRYPKLDKKQSEDMDKLFCPAGAHKICRLEVRVSIGFDYEEFPVALSWTDRWEEYALLDTRDTIRKWMEVLSSSPVTSSGERARFKEVVVRPVVDIDSAWSTEDIIYMTFLAIEPLQSLFAEKLNIETPMADLATFAYRLEGIESHPEYLAFKQDFLLANTNPANSAHAPSGSKNVKVAEAYQKLEQLAQTINRDVLLRHPWMSTVFGKLGLVLHYARLAYECGNLRAFKTFQDYLMKCWDESYRMEQISLTEIKSRLDGLYGKKTNAKGTQNDDAMIPAPNVGKVIGTDSAPSLSGSGVIVKDQGLRVEIQKGDKTWVRMKSPRILKQLEDMEMLAHA